jgi:hypothetical protein
LPNIIHKIIPLNEIVITHWESGCHMEPYRFSIVEQSN